MTVKKPDFGIDTKVVHGEDVLGEPYYRSLSVPIFQSAIFAFDSAEQGARIFSGKEKGYFYTRLGNPTISRFEEKMAYLENGTAACGFASGMAAIAATVFSICQQGEEIVAVSPIYGCTHQLFADLLPRWGIKTKWAKAENFLDELKRKINKKTRLVFIETPVNPTMEVIDIKQTAKIAHQYQILLAVDNTFSTFYNQRPLTLGADIVIHSATKFISGHGDTLGGVIISRGDYIKRIKSLYLRNFGGVMSPFNAWLLLRGLKTLGVRMAKHNENGMRVAEFLAGHPKISKVFYPGLKTHPQYLIAQRQMSGFGSMIAIEMKDGREAGRKLLNNIRLCVCAVSLGDTATLIEHPASMTHSTYSKEELREAGIKEGLVRISVGIEDSKDIINDLSQALSKI